MARPATWSGTCSSNFIRSNRSNRRNPPSGSSALADPRLTLVLGMPFGELRLNYAKPQRARPSAKVLNQLLAPLSPRCCRRTNAPTVCLHSTSSSPTVRFLFMRMSPQDANMVTITRKRVGMESSLKERFIKTSKGVVQGGPVDQSLANSLLLASKWGKLRRVRHGSCSKNSTSMSARGTADTCFINSLLPQETAQRLPREQSPRRTMAKVLII
ncbi:hypothetical protein VTI28DRAFT_6042 [Corynascus sepedonium]